METDKMDLWDELLIDGVIDTLDLNYFLYWNTPRRWPFWKSGTSEMKRLYRRSELKSADVKAIINFCDERIDFPVIVRKRLMHLIAALSCEEMQLHAILILLKEIADYIRKEKINALLGEEIYCLNPLIAKSQRFLLLADMRSWNL